MNAPTSSERFERAIAAIDAANAEDPNTETVENESLPKELVYGWRMSAWLERLAPDASEALGLAARSQHIRRWEIPRSDYPMNRAGYHQWRTTLYRFHADTAANILRDAGYDDATIQRVGELLQKKNLKRDPEAQTLEDAAALVFLQHHLPEFAERSDIDDEKLVDILRKTWKKMSDNGRNAATTIAFDDRLQRLMSQATADA